MHSVNTVVDKKVLREFGLVLGGGILGIFGVLFPWFLHHTFSLGFGLLGSGLIILALVLPAVLKPVYIAWNHLGNLLAWVNTRLILGLLFFCIITPLGIMMRVLGVGLSKPSYRVKKTHRLPNHMEHPF
ncbi:hypothetical protein BegalDRAFT_2237 [Beggiatoa alba B18LD]|uniref:SxtJ n=1 Tax=Beggiatoa alba B18LD TaxID=395493 RepID=I3CHJ9_9GAMM|nr:SxtJ family membrane protein [Beggiatoa alba]EIJ43092.1 hypothetical protein BegalDRAFT_2237 [Beggiatoa alba B18LD]